MVLDNFIGTGRPLADMHTHTCRCGHAGGSDQEYVEAAIAQGLSAIAITDHLPLYWLPSEDRDPTLAMPMSELPAYVDGVLALRERYRDRIQVLLGIEADFIVGHEEELLGLLEAYPFDVVLGSVHWLDGWWVDAPSSLARYRRGPAEVERIWRDYAGELCLAASSGLFDVLAHIDLPKKFGFRPVPSVLATLEEEMAAAVAAGCCAVELSSAGRRKPVGEDYPSGRLLEMLAAAGVPLVLSSDAHAPAEVGYALAELDARLLDLGVEESVLFRGRRLEKIADRASW